MLRADSDPIGDGTDEDLGHRIVVFRRIDVQPGVLGILLQQTLTLKAATYTLTDQLNQVLKLTFIRCFDALKSRGPFVAIDVYAIQEQDVKMYIEVEG